MSPPPHLARLGAALALVALAAVALVAWRGGAASGANDAARSDGAAARTDAATRAADLAPVDDAPGAERAEAEAGDAAPRKAGPSPPPTERAVRVRVVDEVGAPVRAESVALEEKGLRWHEVPGSADGRSVFRGVRPGRYTVVARGLPDGVLGPRRDVPVRVEADADASVEVACVRAGTLRCLVLGPSGEPLAESTVALKPRGDGSVANAPTGPDGTVEFPSLYPDAYGVRVGAPPSGALAEATLPLESETVVHPGQLTEHVVSFPVDGADLAVTVRVRDGGPIEHALVRLVALPPRADGRERDAEEARAVPGQVVATGWTDARGVAEFSALPHALVRVESPLLSVPANRGAEGLHAGPVFPAEDVPSPVVDARHGGSLEATLQVVADPDAATFVVRFAVEGTGEPDARWPLIVRDAAGNDDSIPARFVHLAAAGDGAYVFCARPPAERLRIQTFSDLEFVDPTANEFVVVPGVRAERTLVVRSIR